MHMKYIKRTLVGSKLTIGAALLASSLLSHADDQEIYFSDTSGSGEKANVLLVVDTSGSMGRNVSLTRDAYDPNTDYSSRGSFRKDQLYLELDADEDEDFSLSLLDSSCDDVRDALTNTGRSTGKFQQKNRKGRYKNKITVSSTNDIRCGKGASYTLHLGNYLNWNEIPVSETKTRMAITQEAVTNLADSLTSVNLGIMRYFSNEGGYVDVAIDDIENTRDTIKSKVNGYSPGGYTPLEESFYEAYLYYTGQAPLFNSSFTGDSNSFDGRKYKSPITYNCQKNSIILFTDGQPYYDSTANSRVRTLANSLGTLPSDLSGACSGDGECMDELSYYLYQKNLNEGKKDANGKDLPIQNISTYTIGGFGLTDGTALLQNTAKHGGGTNQYFAANDSAQLSDALDKIFLDILSSDTTFTSPAISVNSFNNSRHNENLFYAVFSPKTSPRWSGNLKKYKALGDGTIIGKNHGGIGASESAIDSGTGFFKSNSMDLWNETGTADGKTVELGGFASLMDPSSRKIVTSLNNSSATLTALSTKNKHATDAALYDASHMDSPEFDKFHRWALGYDVNNENPNFGSSSGHAYIGDPLHTEPLVINYGGTSTSPDSSVFFGTNLGYLYAVDTNDGKEHFAYIPQELLPNLVTYYEDSASVSDKPYGMDGPITAWVNDVDEDGVLYNTDGSLDKDEFALLYTGMRRGGRNLYSLNVTDRTSPKLNFVIEGGSTSGYEKLGYTWSKPVLSKVRWGNSFKIVLFMGGGYDPDQDENTVREDDDIGNAIYMMDAENGDLLWMASNDTATSKGTKITDMKNSIPATVKVVDIDGDGYANYLFAADTGGRLFRFDINQSNSGKANDFADGGIIADIGGNTETTNLRFYTSPSVSIIRDAQKGDYLTLALGSGYRAHPLTDIVEDRFFVFKDFYPYSAPKSYTKITTSDLYDVTSNDYQSSDAVKQQKAADAINKASGWYLRLTAQDGEKILSDALTDDGKVTFPSFSPVQTVSSGKDAICSTSEGNSRMYVLDVRNGGAVADLDGDDKIDRSTSLKTSGIAPKPIIYITKDNEKHTFIGGEKATSETKKDGSGSDPACPVDSVECKVRPLYWRNNKSVNENAPTMP